MRFEAQKAAKVLFHLSGTTLLEVLVSVLVLSFGMFGIVGVQAVSLKTNQASYFRAAATILSLDIIERMRANLDGVHVGAYDDVAGSSSASCFTIKGCTSTQMAAQDILDWSTRAAEVLPFGVAIVCIDSSPADGSADAHDCDGLGGAYAIKIWWDDDRDGAADQVFRTTF